jgi:hypothetical protein
MRNKYAGTCYRCGETVAPGKGHFERHQGGWRTQHANCAVLYRGTVLMPGAGTSSDAKTGEGL